MKLTTLFLFVALSLVNAGQPCMPTNWSYPWLKVGNAWFAQIATPRSWLVYSPIGKIDEECFVNLIVIFLDAVLRT